MTHEDPYALAREAADRLRERTGVDRYDLALVMGSGWARAADELGRADHELDLTDLPGFSAPTACGHGGRLRVLSIGARRALIFLGRVHLYEGHGVAAVVHGVRTAAAAGVATIVLTNSAGGISERFAPGQQVLISDHINLTATSPIVGARFVDLTNLYSARLRALCRGIDSSLAEGVYVQTPGPHYETPAETRMLRTLGGDLVGMSTALEAIAAREARVEVLGLSLVTNVAADLSAQPLDHEEVLAAGQAAAGRVGRLLAEVVRRA